MSCMAMSMHGVIGDMGDIVANYKKVDRFIRFDAALSPAGRGDGKTRKWSAERNRTKRRKRA